MALTSPRFVNEPPLVAIDGGHHGALRNGARGDHVHVLQMALLDLGFSMPKSTGKDYSPDGIYGAETTAIVKEFQKQTTGLDSDGAIGKLTLRALDARFPRFSHRINVHFRSLTLSDVPFDTLLRNAQRVYGRYGIEFFFASGKSLMLSPEEESRFAVVKQDCKWEMDSGEFADLHRMGGSFPSLDVGLFIVGAFQQTDLLGCGGHAKNRPACVVAKNCNAFDPAHEACHVLLGPTFVPVHASGDRRNLMHDTSPDGSTLNERQLAAIRASPLCRAI